MGSDSKRQSSSPQRRIAEHVQEVDAHRFFKLLTGPELRDVVDVFGVNAECRQILSECGE